MADLARIREIVGGDLRSARRRGSGEARRTAAAAVAAEWARAAAFDESRGLPSLALRASVDTPSPASLRSAPSPKGRGIGLRRLRRQGLLWSVIPWHRCAQPPANG